MKTTITEQGIALMNAVIANSAQLTFTAMAVGDGVNINTSSILTDLVNKRLDVGISEVFYSEDGSVVCGNIENSSVEESFEIREIGVFAKKVDSDDEPILFAYIECEGIGGIPAANIVSINNEIRVTIVTGRASVLYIDKTEDVSDLTKKVDNLSKSVEENYYKKSDIDEFATRIGETYCRKSDIAAGLRTQTIIGCNPTDGSESNIDLYLSGDTATVRVRENLVSFPKKTGTISLLSDVEEAIENNPHANLVKWQVYANTLVGETGFARKYVLAMEQYLENPNANTEWITTSTSSTTNPYYLQNPSIPIVDFTVTTANSASPNFSSFNASINVPIFLPNAIDCTNMLINCTKFNKDLHLPSATICNRLLQGATAFASQLSVPNAVDCSHMLNGASAFNQPLYLPNATNCLQMLYAATLFNQPLSLPKATDCRSMLQNATSFKQAVYLPSCSNAQNAFNNTKMSAENISATLDSLPTWTDGGTHIITFTGATGASELTQSSPSVAAATARGWTVKL